METLVMARGIEECHKYIFTQIGFLSFDTLPNHLISILWRHAGIFSSKECAKECFIA
jgi:hypothetical protein